MSQPLKSAQLISSGGFYGAENMLLNLLGAFRDHSVEVVLYVLANSDNTHLEIAARAESGGIPVVIIPCQGRIDRSAIHRLRRSLLASGISVLHTHGYKADLYGFAAAVSAGIPLIATCHNWTKASLALRVYCGMDKWVLRRFERVVAVSPQVEAELRQSGVPRSILRYIANGVTTPAPVESADYASADDVLIVGMATRLVEEKGIEDLLVVASQLVRKAVRLRILIAGDGPLRARFESQASTLGLLDHITFLGFVSDMQSFYNALDIFVLPSLREGFPMSLLEVMAVGKPVVASRVGAIPAAVIHNWSGLLIEPGDTKGLAANLQQLLDDSALRRRLGENARLFIENSYSARVMSEQYLSLYNDVIKGAILQQ